MLPGPRVLKLVVPLGLVIGAAASIRAGTSQQDGCRCATTFQGTGATRQVQCEGFNPTTHGRCECEQIKVDQQVGCRPLAANQPARAATPKGSRRGG